MTTRTRAEQARTGQPPTKQRRSPKPAQPPVTEWMLGLRLDEFERVYTDNRNRGLREVTQDLWAEQGGQLSAQVAAARLGPSGGEASVTAQVLAAPRHYQSSRLRALAGERGGLEFLQVALNLCVIRAAGHQVVRGGCPRCGSQLGHFYVRSDAGPVKQRLATRAQARARLPLPELGHFGVRLGKLGALWSRSEQPWQHAHCLHCPHQGPLLGFIAGAGQ